MDELEQSKLELERERVQGELRAKERELDIKIKEVELKRDEVRAGLWKNPLLVGIIAALIGFLGNSYIAGLQGQQALELEKQKLSNAIQAEHEKRKSDLILESIKTGDAKGAATNLNFLVFFEKQI